jgi:hypothetical protein
MKNSDTYVNCPICGVPDCRREIDGEGFALIFCTNHACKSNGGSYSTFVKGPVNVDEYAIWLTHALSTDEINTLHQLMVEGTTLSTYLGL